MEFSPSNGPIEPVILHPQDPEDAEYLKDLDDFQKEMREQYPTKEKAIEAVAQGLIPLSNFEIIFSKEEMEHIRTEADKRYKELKAEETRRAEGFKQMFS